MTAFDGQSRTESSLQRNTMRLRSRSYAPYRPSADLRSRSEGRHGWSISLCSYRRWMGVARHAQQHECQGKRQRHPVLAGYQADEFALFFQPIHTLDEYYNLIQKRYGDMAAEFEKLYPVTKDEDIKTVKVTAGQDSNRVSLFLWASARVKSHHQPVFTYYFDRAIPWPQHPEFGAFHTGEIPLLLPEPRNAGQAMGDRRRHAGWQCVFLPC